MSLEISTTRSVFAPPPPKEQVALKEMPAPQRPPGALTANIREAMQAVATRGPGQFIDRLI